MDEHGQCDYVNFPLIALGVFMNLKLFKCFQTWNIRGKHSFIFLDALIPLLAPALPQLIPLSLGYDKATTEAIFIF